VDGAWNEIFKAREQIHFFSLSGDRLTIGTPEQPSAGKARDQHAPEGTGEIKTGLT
jgi:hypothetical protein